ncbi:hypothetical protein GCM10022222_38680 [Amycolatopsis ultiminotia]|uniref:Uncharacterized protein n=1 Tax=Amycolatopsis ultiminotia TaxID=543629 RepID=A0ABP6WL91_9PSEU
MHVRIGDRTASDQPHQRVVVQAISGLVGHYSAIAKGDDTVTQTEHLIDAVGDEHHAGARTSNRTRSFEQRFDLVLLKRRSRFI